MSIDLVNLSLKQKNLSLAEHSILNILAYRANDDGECWPSISSLIESSSADRKTVIKVLQSLLRKGLILNTGKMAGKTKRVAVYKLNFNGSKIGTIKKSNSTNFSCNGPKNGAVKQSQKRDMERSDLKDQRKERFSNSEGPKTLKTILEKIRL